MRIALIADVFPPLRSSGAVQLRDLSIEFARQGHEIVVMIRSPEIATPWAVDEMHGVKVLRLRAPKTKDINYVRRTINEFLMPFYMLRNLRKSPFADAKWDGVVWYSPTIFLGPMANALKKISRCKSYLIIRDIFPEWAVDMGLMGRGLPYRFFKIIERYQYSVADVIGVQTPANIPYFENEINPKKSRTELLQNWLSPAHNIGCTIQVSETSLAGRTIFVYAGNMGIAQGLGIILELAKDLQNRPEFGFLFVGRGSDVKHLRDYASKNDLQNVLFFDEIDPTEIPGLFSQCHVGIVALDPRHKTHNIPGKFLTYMQAGLPVLALINPGNDLEQLVNEYNLGRVCTNHSLVALKKTFLGLAGELNQFDEIAVRCKKISDNMFSTCNIVKQVVKSLDH